MYEYAPLGNRLNGNLAQRPLLPLDENIVQSDSSGAVSLDEAKRWLLLPNNDRQYDDEIQRLITFATDEASKYTGEYFTTTVINAYYTHFGNLGFSQKFVSAINSINYYDENNALQTISSDDYFLDQSGRFPALIFDPVPAVDLYQKRSAPVLVQYTSAIPAPEISQTHIQAILYILTKAFENREDYEENGIAEKSKFLLEDLKRHGFL